MPPGVAEPQSMEVKGIVQVASENTPMPAEVAIEPCEATFVLTVTAPKVVRVKVNPVRASAIIVALENFLCAMCYHATCLAP